MLTEKTAAMPRGQAVRSKKPTAGERRALERAIVGRDIYAVRSMLADGMPLDVAHGGVPPLFLAAAHASPEMIDVLVEAGADPNRILVGRANGQGSARTALNAAAAGARVESAARLLDHGANPSVPDDEGRNAAHLLVSATHYAKLVDLLPPLCVVLRRMLDMGVPVDAVDASGSTLLHYAVRREMPIEGLNLLIERGANPALPDNDGITPLQAACLGPNPAAITLLVNLGADLNQRAPSGQPLLHWTTTGENLEALLAFGPDLDARDAEGRTALFCALDQWKYSDYPDEPLFPWKAARLIAAGASLDTPDNEGLTPRDIIARDGITDVLPLIPARDRGAN
jgi:ankyrin repeat protein